MAECTDCIYSKMCYLIALFGEETPCEHFIPAADFVPRSKYDLAVAEREANVKGFAETLKTIKSESVKEFAERLHKQIDDFREKREMVMLLYTEAALLSVEKKIDNLVKEFTEGVATE